MKYQQKGVYKNILFCLIIFFFGLINATVTHAETYNFVAKWGSYGNVDGQFHYQEGVAVDSSGNVYVADNYNNRIQKFDSSGTFITKWGSPGSGDGQFIYPHGVAVDSSGNVYVADTYNNCIQKFVYDSQGVFVTGGGWINSPAGAYVLDNTLAGKVTFGFVSKYEKDTTVPIGKTEFQFKFADLNFHSENYDWLVVAGSQAKYKGTGTINGKGNYGFMLSAIDGAIKGDGIDKFRIKIWDKESGNIIYDNEIGTGEDAELSTAIGGGSVIIHKEK